MGWRGQAAVWKQQSPPVPYKEQQRSGAASRGHHSEKSCRAVRTKDRNQTFRFFICGPIIVRSQSAMRLSSEVCLRVSAGLTFVSTAAQTEPRRCWGQSTSGPWSVSPRLSLCSRGRCWLWPHPRDCTWWFGNFVCWLCLSLSCMWVRLRPSCSSVTSIQRRVCTGGPPFCSLEPLMTAWPSSSTCRWESGHDYKLQLWRCGV